MTVAIVAENERAVIGGNRPPISESLKDAVADLPERLPVEFSAIKARTEELVAAFGRVPAVVTDENAGMVSDQIAQISAHVTEADAFRTAATKPVVTAQRTINTWFDKNCFDALDVPKSTTAAKQVLTARLSAYEIAKANAERLRREEEERAAQARATEAARIARVEAERVERERLAAEHAEQERIAAIQNEKDLNKAIELAEENKRIADEREAQARAAAEEAERLRAEAEKAAASAAARPAAMHVVRGDSGSSSTLRTTWKARRTSKDVPVDLNALRDFIGADVVEKAANAFARTHKNTKPVTGLEFYEDSSAVVRG
jgi:hypothetical protein